MNGKELSNQEALALIDRLADATRAIAWAEAGGDDANESDIKDRDEAEAELLAKLVG